MLLLHNDGILWSYDAMLYGNELNREARSTKSVRMSPKLFPEICDSLEKHLEGYYVNQFDFLIYKVGDFFIKHKDDHGQGTRTYTTVTMMEKSDDLVGGNLVIYDKEETFVINLEVGETIIFPASMDHEATVVEQGSRKVLVAWLN